jgi:hypothetical protein
MNTPNSIKVIAKQILNLDTLETRKSDELDFQEQAVWGIKEALELAFKAGQGQVVCLKYQGEDYWSRKSYEDQNKNIWVEVDGVLHSTTSQGEPMSPIRDYIRVIHV